MPSFVASCTAWCRRRLGWSNSRQSWQERLAGALLLAGAVLLSWYGGRLPLSRPGILWGVLILALALLLRRGWLKLFGPVLFHDMVRTARRGRYAWLRCGYLLALLLLLLWVYRTWSWQLERY